MATASSEATTPSTRPARDILLVEDNPADVRLLHEAFREGDVPDRVHVARTGEEALGMLRDPAGVLEPDVILLDLNLPGLDGREVLRELKDDPDLHRIPVIVLTTSRAPKDVDACYDLHANWYVTKPVNLDRFMDLVHRIDRCWLDIVTLPTPRTASRSSPNP